MSGYSQAVDDLRSNLGQWTAFESEGHCLVLAGPGSGKTKTLTIKMARLLREVRRPRGVACVTYNNECAKELRRRLTALEVDESDRCFVGTLHGFCLRHILAPFARLAESPVPLPLRVAKESERVSAMTAAMGTELMYGDPSRLLSDNDKLRRTFIDRSKASGWEDSEPAERLCVAYERLLAAQGLLDFDGIILAALRLVERHAWVRKALQARFPIFVVDEYQDLGLALHRLVMSLCFGGNVRLFAVGDPDQSIYGFTGARPELLGNLSDREDVLTVRLKLNYRSGQRIVDASSVILGEEREYESARSDSGTIIFHPCSGGVSAEVAKAIGNVLPNVLTRVRPGEVAILHPTKNEGLQVETALLDSKVQFVRLGREAAYPRTLLNRLLEELAEWSARGWRTGNPQLSRLTGRWLRLLGVLEPRARRDGLRRLVRFLFEHREGDGAAGDWIKAFEEIVVTAGDCRERLELAGEIEGFEALKSALQPGGRLETFTVRNLSGQAGSPDHVNLVTLHSSKGCEFRVVMIVGADEGLMPSTYATSPSAIAEARRLFYVALSRAQEEVHIFSSNESRFVSGLRRALEDT